MRGVLAACWIGLALAAGAEEEASVPPVAEVISEVVREMGAPAAPPVPRGVGMLVSTSSEAAQTSVRHGLTCLHAGWDFEAYRHFCAALQEDESCLMAHWGAAISLLQGDASEADEREAALLRMLALVDRGVGTDLERRYAFALSELVAEGIDAASIAFANLAERYPKDPQARMLNALFGRAGYDEFGDARPDQERAERTMRELVAEHPDSPWLLYALLAIRAESPELEGDLEGARRLVTMAPDFPPYQHLRGHYEWRSGHHDLARTAFALAAEGYSAWMKSAGTDELRCPGWTKAESYRAVALASQGQYETALAVAEGIAKIEVPPERARGAGGRALLWEGATLGARLLMRRAGEGDLKRALATLPPPERARLYTENSLVVWAWQSYAAVLAARISLEQGRVKDAWRVSADLTRIGEAFVETGALAVERGERSEWLRMFRALEVMASELRGLIAMAGEAGDRGSALNWYRAASDRQALASLMMPPMVLLPMEVRLGQYFAADEEWERALEELEAAGKLWPNDCEVLAEQVRVLDAAGEGERADEIRGWLRTMRER